MIAASEDGALEQQEHSRNRHKQWVTVKKKC